MASDHPPASRPVRVLHLVHWPRSGITSVLKSLVAFSDKDSFEHHIAFLIGEPDEIRGFAAQGCTAVDLGFAHDPAGAILRLRATVGRQEGGLVHSHSFQPGVWGRLFHHRERTGFLSSVHSTYPYFLERTLGERVKSRVEQFSIKRVGHPVVAVSDAVRQHLLAHTGIAPELIRLIRNGIDTQVSFQPGTVDPAVRQAANLGPQDRYAITVARLSREKGTDILLRAWPAVGGKHRDLKLVVVGDGAEAGPLRELARELGVADSVYFAGFQSNVLTWLAGAALFVNPSRFEGLPMGVLEAQVARVPLVATAVGGVPEVVTDGVSGRLVAAENPVALASAMEDLLAHPERARVMAENAYRKVRAGYDIRQTVRNHEDLYREILAGRDRGR